MNLNAPVARSRPMGRYTLNRQLAREAPFILQDHKHLVSAYGRLTYSKFPENRTEIGNVYLIDN